MGIGVSLEGRLGSIRVPSQYSRIQQYQPSRHNITAEHKTNSRTTQNPPQHTSSSTTAPHTLQHN